MSKRKPDGIQSDTINRNSPFTQMSFDLRKQDQFVNSLAVDFVHYKAMPSPIGKNDRGSYRRNDGVDTITSNGMIYRCAGKFSAVMTDNDRSQKRSQSGIVDPSQSRLVLPRFYNKDDQADGERIYMAPGDRLYVSDPDADVLVSNYQEMDYEPENDNVPMFPIVKVEQSIIDSRNIEYTCGLDYKITDSGNIRWLATGKNPGIDADTGKGRVYSVRYLYRAFWYVVSLPKEVRITNVTNGNVRSPERMAYNAVIVREFMFHNQNKGDAQNQNISKTPNRAAAVPKPAAQPDKYVIPVDMAAIDDDEGQS
jgi:hypothetical protein